MGDKIENGSTSVFDIFENLRHGELAQYAIGNSGSGRIEEENYPKVMSALNRGVSQIQQDLNLNENSVRIELLSHIVTYPIHSKHSIIHGTSDIKFVADSVAAPFEDDILRILNVYDECGTELPINTRNSEFTIYVPQHNVIQHTCPKTGMSLGINYSRRTQPVSVTDEENAKSTYIPIPDYALMALYPYIASKMTAGITNDQEISESQMWRNEYETAIAKMKHNPAVPTDSYQNSKLTDNGFI